MDRVSERREPFVSYSINYEDVILRRLFPGKADGFFVDVGAQHPKLDNDFFGLYELGWRGINVEPNSSYFALLQTIRVGDRNLQLALSDVEDEPITFFEVEGSGLSTCDEQQAMACVAQGYTIRRHDLQTSTLRRLLEQERPPHIDIMKVDVEGLEEKVLAGNDWTRFRPSVVLVEATYPETPVKRPTGITASLTAAGYRHVHFDGLNDFYAEESFVPPPGAFAPPNVFDRFVRIEMVAVRDENAALQREIQAHKANFSSAEAYSHDLEAARLTLEQRLSEMTAEQASAEQEIRRLREEADREIQAHKANFKSAEAYAHDLEAARLTLEQRLSEVTAEQASLQQRVVKLEPLESAYREAEQEIGHLREELEQARGTLRVCRRILSAALLDKTRDLDNLIGIAGYNPSLKGSMNLSYQQSNDPQSLVVVDRTVLDENGSDIETLPPELMMELLRQRMRGLAAARDRLANDIDDLRQENRRLLLAVSQLQGENLSLNRALRPAQHAGRELAIMSAALERVCDRLEEGNAHSMQETAKREHDVAEAGRKTALAEALAAQARLRVEALETSTSWRLTKPVRVLGRLLKGRR
jgi:FkbM family methyltransferase